MSDDADEFDALLAELHDLGYDSIDPTVGYENEASGRVDLPPEYRIDADGWRRFVPRLLDGGDTDLVPDDLRAAVEDRGWTVQPMGRSRETVTVVVSKNGV